MEREETKPKIPIIARPPEEVTEPTQNLSKEETKPIILEYKMTTLHVSEGIAEEVRNFAEKLSREKNQMIKHCIDPDAEKLDRILDSLLNLGLELSLVNDIFPKIGPKEERCKNPITDYLWDNLNHQLIDEKRKIEIKIQIPFWICYVLPDCRHCVNINRYQYRDQIVMSKIK